MREKPKGHSEGHLLGREEIIGKQKLSKNMQPCHLAVNVFSVKMSFIIVEIISVLIVSDHCNKFTMAQAYVLFK